MTSVELLQQHSGGAVKTARRVIAIAATAAVLLPGVVAGQPPALAPADSFAERINGLAFTEAPFTCRTSLPRRTIVDSEALIREYLGTRMLADNAASRAFMDALLDYQRRPTVVRLNRLVQSEDALESRSLVAEDIARCVVAHSPYAYDRSTDHAQTVADALEGNHVRARAMLVAIKNCPNELIEVELRSGHPYRALEIREETDAGAPAVIIEALARLRACEWAWRDLEHLKPRPATDDLRRVVEGRCPMRPRRAATVKNAPSLARLAAPRLRPFVEVPLGRIHDFERWWRHTTVQHRTVPYAALAGFTVETISPSATHMFVVSLSDAVHQSRTPGDDVWIHVSSDEGVHWDGPYYLGLSERFVDYRRLNAHEPSARGTRLPLEVEAVEGARSPSAPASVAHYRLDIDLDALRRDSDGDGLTDLLEEKLLMDPRARDTDGDGINDAADMLPLEAQDSQEPSHVREVWADLIPVLAGVRTIPRATVATPTKPAVDAAAQPFRPLLTLFVGPSECPVTHATPVRVICLDRAMLASYRTRFGDLSLMDVSQIVFDETHQHALVRYAFPYSGGTLRAVKQNGEWRFQTLRTWVE